jgi:hypothetical protein
MDTDKAATNPLPVPGDQQLPPPPQADTYQQQQQQQQQQQGQQGSEDEWGPDGLPSVRALAYVLARIAANAHTICDEELQPLGTGLYPLMAIANHASRPSCMQSFTGRVMQFRALREVKPGDEVRGVGWRQVASAGVQAWWR